MTQQSPAILRGAAAILEALDLMGREEKTDHDLAKIIVDAEIDLRAIVQAALEQQAGYLG